MRVAVVCYALSFSAHAGVLTLFAYAPMPPTSARASRANEMPQGERKVVQVTLMMRMSDLAEPGESLATGQSTGDPTTGQGKPLRTDKPAPQETLQPSAAENTTSRETTDSIASARASSPDTASEPNEPERLAQRAETESTPAPPTRETAESKAVQTPSEAQPLDQDQLAEITQQLLQRLLPERREQPSTSADTSIEQQEPEQPVTIALANHAKTIVAELNADNEPPAPKPTATAPVAKQQATEPNAATDQSVQTEPAAEQQRTDASTTDADTAPPPPAAATASAEPAQPEALPVTEDVADAVSKVYDERSVDQPITFDKRGRLVQSYRSKQLGETGTIRIFVVVDAQGRLVRYDVIEDAEKPRLLKAALAALKKSTFTPASLDGTPVRSSRMIEYQF